MSKNFDFGKKIYVGWGFIFLKQLKYYYVITLTLGFCLPLQCLTIFQRSASFLVLQHVSGLDNFLPLFVWFLVFRS